MVPTSCSGPNFSCLISCSPGFGLLATLAIDATDRDVKGCAFNLNTCAGTVGGATRSATVRSCCRTVAAEPRTGLGNGVSFRGGTPASGRLMRVKRGFGIEILQVVWFWSLVPPDDVGVRSRDGHGYSGRSHVRRDRGRGQYLLPPNPGDSHLHLRCRRVTDGLQREGEIGRAHV